MEHPQKIAHQQAVVYALIHGATYLPAVWLLKHHMVQQPVSLVIAAVPIITFCIFILKLIKSFSVMDEVRQRVQLEAVVIGFSLTIILLMILFLRELCGISNPGWFGYPFLVIYGWLFYFAGWYLSRKKYGV